ncbi:MAG: 1-(5-phosphoribosyl)-5-[(5-phosphoribosylamino)methylideneamino]imidazole-4-carboxamide isomerase [Chromatiales bacterium]|jgi:phosphoribosylformimino-5-aminoimidazole carboxamide ribotide isomerase|nr:1-(5-phosphoribosyl)-5-[(5-phosphoribosylamino)methylideneamino]imidazole-4-carboxamide isomerase [Chromatiales bacterium]
MLLIPAIDIKDGQCVRLRQGRMDDSTVFSNDPVAMATRWVEAGAQRLHIVDLNGATAGKPVNARVIRDIVQAHPGVPLQVGGGIRDEDAIETYLEIGVSFAIIGTAAVKEPHFVADAAVSFPGHIIVGLDARDGKVAIDGWSKLSNHDVIDIAQHFERDGVSAIIYTDISRDGMLTGVNVDATVRLARSVRIPIIASGGIAGMNDIHALCDVSAEGVTGAILGRALYEGQLDFAQAQRYVESRT